MITRALSTHIKQSIKKYHALSVTGPRQSGKTTLVRRLFPNFLYMNLEIPDRRAFAIGDPKAFLLQSKRMIIDEIQYAPELLSYIQGYIDEDPFKRYIITGSQNFSLSQSISQSLSGRVHLVTLLPLSVSELHKARILPTSLSHQLYTGMYPRVYHEKLESSEWYGDYIHTYLERDVRQIKQIGDLSLFQKFMSLIAGRTGQILDLTSLANDVGISVPTIQSWISVLEASYIIFRLQPYYANFNKRLVKSPKLHFYDTGLVCALLNIRKPRELTTHPLMGAIFESFVVSEYTKKIANKELTGSLYYWREKNGKEIDLIIDHPTRPYAIEVKASQTISETQTANIRYFGRLTQKPFSTQLIYAGNEEERHSNYSLISWRKL